MNHDILTIEVGSTITKANAFRLGTDGRFHHLAQGFSATTVEDGDVGIGVDQVMVHVQKNLPCELQDPEIFINSSAAGGLRMTVHGLTHSMRRTPTGELSSAPEEA